MSTKIQSTVIETMHARKSIRKYDPDFKLTNAEITELLVDATTAPSTSNLQPTRFIVITDEQKKKELRQIAFNQEQVETSSAVIAIIGDDEFYKKAEHIGQLCQETAGMTAEIAAVQTENAHKLYGGLPKESRMALAMYDAGLVSMQLALAAKARGLDTVIMGGYNKPAFAQAYNLPANEFPIVLIAVGKGTGPARGTARLNIEDITRFV